MNAQPPRFLTNLLATGLSEGVARLAQLAAVALILRALPEGEFGTYGIAWSFAQMALAFVQVGPEMIGMRDYRTIGNAGSVVWAVTRLKLVLCIVSIVAMLGTTILLYGVASNILVQTALQASVLVPIALNNGWVLRAESQFTEFAALRIGQSLGFLAAVAILLPMWPTARAIPVAEAVVCLLSAVLVWPRVSIFMARYASSPTDAPQSVSIQEILRGALAIGLTTVCSTVFWTIPIPLGGLYLKAGQLDGVAAASRLLAALNGLCQMFIQVFYPALVKRYASDRQDGARLTGGLFVLSLAAGLTLTAALGLSASALVPLLIGNEQVEAVHVFKLWVPVLIPAATGSVFGYSLIATGQVRVFTLITISSTLLAAAACWAGFAIQQSPGAAAWVSIAMLGYATSLGIAARRYDLIVLNKSAWSILRPAALRRFLADR